MAVSGVVSRRAPGRERAAPPVADPRVGRAPSTCPPGPDGRAGEDTSGDEQAPLTASGPVSRGCAGLLWVLALVGLTAGLATLGRLSAVRARPSRSSRPRWASPSRSAWPSAAAPTCSWLALAWPSGVGAVGTAVAAPARGSCRRHRRGRRVPRRAGHPAGPTSRRSSARSCSRCSWPASAGSVSPGSRADLDVERFGYTVLGLALVAIAAAGLPAGRRPARARPPRPDPGGGARSCCSLVVLVYTAALTRYGSPELVAQVRSAQDWTRDHLGGVPHPLEVLDRDPGPGVGGLPAVPAPTGLVGVRLRRGRDRRDPSARCSTSGCRRGEPALGARSTASSSGWCWASS